MQPFAEFPAAARSTIRYVLTDIDDTLTHQGLLPGETYLALERLSKAGFKIIPVTAACSGWCDLIAKMWPVDAVVGENGGLYFHRDRDHGPIIRRYWSPAIEQEKNVRHLASLAEHIQLSVPGTKLASDQIYRETTLAITSSNEALPDEATTELVLDLLRVAGARTTTNSMWILGWLGGFDKLSMTRRAIAEVLAIDIEAERQAFLYVGDSLNDEPMFRFFPNSVGVATVTRFLDRLSAPPRWVTRGPGGVGFTEIVDTLLQQDSL
jgi:HAD superfamily hydrolase (TIGR01484 family)